MKKFALIATALAAIVASAPAAAATYSFAGDFGNPVFSYGTAAGTSFTAFGTSDCGDINVSGLCYRGSDQYQVVFRRTATDLVLHPGPGDAQNTLLVFTAPTTGNYTFSVNVARGDSGDGVNVYTFNNLQGGLNLVGRVDAANPLFTYSGTQFFTAGQQVGIGVDRGGADPSNYFGDSTLFNGTVANAVPEPATWAMMLLGFGMVGFGLRRRKADVRTAVRFA